MVASPDWLALAESVTDDELARFRREICITGGHIGMANIGRCSRCGGATSSGSMTLCHACATDLGVCAWDQRRVAIRGNATEEAAATMAAARWLALLARGYSIERAAARRALVAADIAGVADVVDDADDSAAPGRSPTLAEFIVGFDGRLAEPPVEGGELLGAPVLSVNPAIASAVVRPADARAFEKAALATPGVRYVELNRSIADLPVE